MWLFTKHGFYSIVRDTENPNVYKCRARKKKDIENLISNFSYLKEYKIVYDNRADYHYRIIIHKVHFSMLMLSLSHALDYSNFKNYIGKSKDQRDKTHCYSDIWEIMYEYQ